MRTGWSDRRWQRMSRRLLRGLAVAAVLPLLLLEAGAARALYRCMYDGVARSACCCPEKVSLPHEPASSVTSPCCCTVERPSGSPAQAQARVERTSTTELSAPLVAVVPRVAFTDPRLASRAFHARAGVDPPYARPPLILLKSSLLL